MAEKRYSEKNKNPTLRGRIMGGELINFVSEKTGEDLFEVYFEPQDWKTICQASTLKNMTEEEFIIDALRKAIAE